MKIHTTNLQAHYEDGHVTYLRAGDEEIVRMIYIALRTNTWYTVPMTITDEKIEQHPNAFAIQYKATFLSGDIRYEAIVQILGKEDDTISFHFKGIATSQFLKNRIGICVHHPIKECLDQPVSITQPEHIIIPSAFPTLIEPFLVFSNILKCSWKTPQGIEAMLEFEGDIFESEDQRNWSDSSFKTYSTPLRIPFPVMVQPGEVVEQKVILSLSNKVPVEAVKPMEAEYPELRFPFPALGYTRSDIQLTDEYINMLKQIIFNHYRIEIDFKEGWIEKLNNAYLEAEALDTQLELVVFFDHYISEYEQLKKQLNTRVGSLFIIQNGDAVPDTSFLDEIIPKIRFDFPFIKIGTGTNNHFVDINRNRIIDPRVDFVSYGATPQAHLPFRHILIENLEALQYPVTTLRSFTDKPIHVSPLTLKARDYPALSTDERQHTPMIADWMVISFKYLAGIHHLTVFETIGPKGVINENGPSPIYEVLKKISAFRPVFIIKTKADHPLEKDSLILENEAGERMVLEAMF